MTDLELLKLQAEASGTTLQSMDGGDINLVYILDSEGHFTTGDDIERSDGSISTWLPDANPGNWHPVEWNELLDGVLGPWTMVTEGQRVLSICHTPLPMTEQVAECGVWTDPACRRRGHATAATAEWAALLRPTGRHLFYCTSPDNLASQRVAARLRARFLGKTWSPPRSDDTPADAPSLGAVHPLSSLVERSGLR